jgi:hypothetical protein
MLVVLILSQFVQIYLTHPANPIAPYTIPIAVTKREATITTSTEFLILYASENSAFIIFLCLVCQCQGSFSLSDDADWDIED